MLSRVHYGWYVVAVLFLCTALMVGITSYAFGVFVTALKGDLGWSQAQIFVGLSLSSVGMLLSPLVGRAVDKIGARRVMAASFAVLGLSYLLRPWMTELWHFYALSILQSLGMPGSVGLPTGKLIGLWFEKNRGRVMGFAVMGANFGGFIFSYLTVVLINAWGWAGAYFFYGVLFAAIIPVILAVIRDPAVPYVASGTVQPAFVRGAGLSLSEALRTRAFYLIAVGLLLGSFTYSAVFPQVVPHLQNIGIPRAQAAAALSIFAIFAMAGKVIFGYTAERVPARYVVVGSLGIQVSGIIVLLLAPAPFIWLFVPVYGISFGGMGTVINLVVQDSFGVRHFGSIFGIMNVVMLGGNFLGPILAGYSFDATGSYRFIFSIMAVVFTLGAVVIAFARPPRLAPAPAADRPAAAEGAKVVG